MITDDKKISLDTDPIDVPWIFRNRDLTIPATRELKKYLQLVLDDDPEHLRFLYRRSQEYCKFGGANAYTWKRWLNKLTKDVNNTTFP